MLAPSSRFTFYVLRFTTSHDAKYTPTVSEKDKNMISISLDSFPKANKVPARYAAEACGKVRVDEIPALDSFPKAEPGARQVCC